MEDEERFHKRPAGLASKVPRTLPPSSSKSHLDKYAFGISHYRHGTEIIRIGDLVRLVTASRQTRNLVVSPTHHTLLVTALVYSSEGIISPVSHRVRWERSVLLEGEVCDAHVLEPGSWVTTGEIRTVDSGGISGKWYSHYPKLSKKMPLVEQELWIGEGLREHSGDGDAL